MFYDELRVGDRCYFFDRDGRKASGVITRLVPDGTAGAQSHVYVRLDSSILRFGERVKAVAMLPEAIHLDSEEL